MWLKVSEEWLKKMSLKGTSACFLVFALSLMLFQTSFCDDFPSLLTANASIAIILDREYLDVEYDETLKEIKVKTFQVSIEKIQKLHP